MSKALIIIALVLIIGSVHSNTLFDFVIEEESRDVDYQTSSITEKILAQDKHYMNNPELLEEDKKEWKDLLRKHLWYEFQ